MFLHKSFMIDKCVIFHKHVMKKARITLVFKISNIYDEAIMIVKRSFTVCN
jgi:hypothetical protein